MSKYKNLILNSLLDSYEKSLSYVGLNKQNQSISFNVNKKNIKDYFNEEGTSYYEINDLCIELEKLNLISIKWKNNRVNHIIEKLILNFDNIDDIYSKVNRKEKKDKNKDVVQILNKYNYNDVIARFKEYIIKRIKANKSIKQYFDIDNCIELEEILVGVNAVLSNVEEIFLRELSIKLYKDSKRLESLEVKIKRIIIDFSKDKEELLEVDELLSEFNILKNPSFVYFKGNGEFTINENVIKIESFPKGIGISSLDLEYIKFTYEDNVKNIITIENLTSYNRFYQDNTLVIYLGGYHNKARKNLLIKIYDTYNKSNFIHWGDIDAGGFKILNHLRNSTKIPFKSYKMDKQTLVKYKGYGKELTVNDKKELERLYYTSEYSDFKEVIEYMLKENTKLEQEIM